MTVSNGRNPFSAVIFDVDGTLVDSERDGHRVAFNIAFGEFGLQDRWDVETYGRLIRTAGGQQRLAAWFRSQGYLQADIVELATRLHRRKTEIMRELVDEGLIGPRPGVVAILDRLAAARVPVHIATTGNRAWVDPLLSRVFGNRFDVVVTGSEIGKLKPDPAVYLEVMRRIGGSAGVVAVEDSANGVRSATGAGLPVVVTANPYTQDDDFTGAALITGGCDDPRLIDWFSARLLPCSPGS